MSSKPTSKGPRKSRSKSHDGTTMDDAEQPSSSTTSRSSSISTKEVKKTRSKSHDHATTTSSGTRRVKRNGSLKKNGSSMSLEDGLSQIAAAPSLLQRQDFGRSEDDDDTFCGTGTVDGEIKRGKLHIKNKSNNNNTTTTSSSSAQRRNNSRPNPFGNVAADPFGGKSAFGRRDDDDDDSEEDDEVDFFAGASNPFKDLKKKSSAKRTTIL